MVLNENKEAGVLNGYLLLMGIVIIICVGLHRFTEKIQIPSL